MSRIEQINELLKNELGNAISREVPMDSGLITITRVECSPNLQYAAIFISVLPVNLSGTALKSLRQASSSFSGILKKKLRMRSIPKFNWKIDEGERHAAEIDDAIAAIAKEDYYDERKI